MSGFVKSSVEQCSIEEQKKDITLGDVFEENEWNSFDEAMELVVDGAEDIKRITDLCIQTHFSPEEQEWICPVLYPVYSDPDAGMHDDGISPFARFEAHDVDGKVVLSAEITAKGLYAFKYRPAGSDALIMDNAPYYCIDGALPEKPTTTMKWALFTTALTYLLKFGCCDLVLGAFYMDTTWKWEASNEEQEAESKC